MDWPLFDLRLRCRGLELRVPREDELLALAGVLPDDVGHDPRLPHLDWQDRAANERRIFLQGHWRALADWTPHEWVLPLAVERGGELVGVQSLEGSHFATLGTVDSASWLVRSARGQGVGVAMRMAVLGLAFDHLGAEYAVSGATLDNAASLGVSRRLGYVDNGLGLVRETHRVSPLQHLRLDRADWRHAAEVEVTGVEACRPWFGATEQA